MQGGYHGHASESMPACSKCREWRRERVWLRGGHGGSVHPILFHVGDYALHTFGLMAALGVLAGSAVVLAEARREAVDEDLIRRTTFVAVIAVIVGGRMLDVIVNWRRFQDAPADAFKIWKGGLVFYGGA